EYFCWLYYNGVGLF
nr:immunoglobulin light chain junction region [Macaca mulatta]MOV98594.1 immunoglobulin light chain junction region [Macaca mulatta]